MSSPTDHTLVQLLKVNTSSRALQADLSKLSFVLGGRLPISAAGQVELLHFLVRLHPRLVRGGDGGPPSHQEERRGRLRQRACRALAPPRALRRPDSKREQGRAGACESRASASASDGAYRWIARASMPSSRASSATSATRFNMKRRKSRGCGPRAGSGDEGEWRPDLGEPAVERGS